MTREESVKKLREEYPAGTKIRLTHMDDMQAPPVGTLGIISCVDDIGTIHVKWENGSTLGVVPEVDQWEVVKSPIHTKEELYDAVMEEYRKNSTELSEGYLHGLWVDMTKKDFLLAWASLQKDCNNDTLIRIYPSAESFPQIIYEKDGKSFDFELADTLIPEGWDKITVCGDAEQVLHAIDEERLAQNPIIFARLTDDPYLFNLCIAASNSHFADAEHGELLSLIFGKFEPDGIPMPTVQLDSMEQERQ